MKKRVYSKEFKEQAVRLSYQRDNIKDLADELGLDPQRIYKWRRALKSSSHPKEDKTTTASVEEIKRLQKALREKEQELTILKKAVHIFSKSDGKFTNL